MRRNHQLLRTLVCGALVAAGVALAGSITDAAGITVTFPTRLTAAPDYATDVLGDAWDMCNPEDVSPFPYELVGFSSFSFSSSPCRAGGTTQLVNGIADSSVVFLYRGIYGVVNPGRNGRNFPIDTSKYQILSYKLYSSLAGQGPQLYWFHNPFSHPAGDALGVRYSPITTVNGMQIVRADLGGVPDQGLRWDNGPAVGLRIDPNSSSAGQSVSFGWVRLTPATGSVQPITWSGGSGNTTIDLRDNSDATTLQIASGNLSSPYSWNYGFLPPGNYTLTVTRGTSNGSATFTINHPPTIQVIDPSSTTGEDYATKVLGNPWDMSDPGDLQITNLEHTTPLTFSGGQASATNITDDPNVTLLNSANNAIPIDTNKYRYLTYRFQVDGPFSLYLGSIARVLWSSDTYLGPNTTTTRDILVWPGMNTYTIDLASLSAAPDGGLETSGAAASWTAAATRNLRFDPHESPQAQTFHIDDIKLTAKPVAAGFFTIKFAASDADGDPATVSLYYDTDTNAANGRTLIASGIAMSAGQFGWNTYGVPQGDYYIYAEANDGLQTAGRYSEVPVQVSAQAGQARPGDFDGDGTTDITVFRPSDGTWSVLKSSSGYATWDIRQWGVTGDVPVPGDYDGDRKVDLAIYRPSTGTWYVLQSSTSYTTWIIKQWGISGDVAVPGDYDGDGKTDIAIYRPSTGTWYLLQSSTNFTTWLIMQWGISGDLPMPGDYDGDRKTDMAVYRPSDGTWYLLKSSTSSTTWIIKQWGISGDVPVPGDYDGDGKTDMAIYRPSDGTWYLLKSSTSSTTWIIKQWGISGDVPVPGDYDGDGKTDIAIYRPSTGTWYLLKSSTSYTTWIISQWGINGDLPAVQH